MVPDFFFRYTSTQILAWLWIRTKWGVADLRWVATELGNVVSHPVETCHLRNNKSEEEKKGVSYRVSLGALIVNWLQDYCPALLNVEPNYYNVLVALNQPFCPTLQNYHWPIKCVQGRYIYIPSMYICLCIIFEITYQLIDYTRCLVCTQCTLYNLPIGRLGMLGSITSFH